MYWAAWAASRNSRSTCAATRPSGASFPSPRPTAAASQRAWIAFRDAQCAFESSAMEGGTAAPLLFSGCAAQLTRERAKELRDLREARVYE